MWRQLKRKRTSTPVPQDVENEDFWTTCSTIEPTNQDVVHENHQSDSNSTSDVSGDEEQERSLISISSIHLGRQTRDRSEASASAVGKWQ